MGRVPFVPTPDSVVRTAFREAGVKAGDTILDLGCGDGTVLIIAAKEFEANGVGYEIDERLATKAVENVNRHGLAEKIRIINDDLRNAVDDVESADFVWTYLTPSLMKEIKGMLSKAKKLISYSFPIAGLKPSRTIGNRIYLYDFESGVEEYDVGQEEKKSVFATYDEYVGFIAHKYKPLLMNITGVVDVVPTGAVITVLTESESNTELPKMIEGVRIAKKII